MERRPGGRSRTTAGRRMDHSPRKGSPMADPQDRPTVLSGANAEFLDRLYEQFLQQPASLDPQWREFFAQLQAAPGNGGAAAREAPAPPAVPTIGEALSAKLAQIEPVGRGDTRVLTKQAAVFQLINNYRTFGHAHA